jgi:hypothetical protein
MQVKKHMQLEQLQQSVYYKSEHEKFMPIFNNWSCKMSKFPTCFLYVTDLLFALIHLVVLEPSTIYLHLDHADSVATFCSHVVIVPTFP